MMMRKERNMTVKNSVREVKTALAKLLATENLTVEFAQVQTASFDVKNRVLRLPIFKSEEQDPTVLDLFVGHEVAHALWTPAEGLENLPNKTENFHSFVNVTEDARIERFIQNKYPGLKRVFYNAYGQLKERDFFGIEKVENLDSMLFIDRLNLKAKLGTQINIEFEGEELEFYNRSMTTQSFEEVVKLAEDIFEYCKEELEEKQNQDDTNELYKAQMEEDENSDNDGDNKVEASPTSADWSTEGAEDGNQEDDGSDAQNESEEGATEDANAEKVSDEIKDEKDSDETTDVSIKSLGSAGAKSITDIAGQNALQSMVDMDEENVVRYLDIPKSVDIDKFIVPFKTVHAEILEYWTANRRDSALAEYAKKFKVKNQKVINYLHKEFEMKKAAQVYSNSFDTKTGVINTQKLFSYKFNEDIFKKSTVAPNGQSHGIVFFLDWSGSMANNLKGTMEQLINLALFCRKSNIPFDAYSFSSEYQKNDMIGNKSKWQSTNLHEAALGNCALIEMFNHKMNTRQFNKSVEIWLAVSNMFSRQSGGDFMYWGLPRKYYLSGTPLNEAIVLAMKVVPYFQKKANVDIVNTCFLTDGSSHSLEGNFSIDPYNGREWISDQYSVASTLYVRDKKTASQIEIKSEKYNRNRNRITKALYMMLKKVTGCNLVGFFVCDQRDINYAYDTFVNDDTPSSSIMQANEKRQEFRKQFNREKAVVGTQSGMDELYILKGGKHLEIVDEGLNVDPKASKAQITTAFKKMNRGKLTNRVILSKFIEKISA